MTGDVPMEVVLSKEVADAGLVVTMLLPLQCTTTDREEFEIQLWQPDGGIWAEGTHQPANVVRRHIQRWRQPR